MSRTDTAYRTADPDVVEAWQAYAARTKRVSDKRAALVEQYGRNLWVVRSGFGHGTHIVGFERFDSDKDGDLLADGALIVSSRRGQHNGLVVPNLRRKSGKDFDRQLRALRTTGPDLPGMPAFHLSGDDDGGVHSMSPALWFWDGAVYSLWGCDDAPVGDNWEQIPLSTYYLASEQYEKEQADG